MLLIKLPSKLHLEAASIHFKVLISLLQAHLFLFSRNYPYLSILFYVFLSSYPFHLKSILIWIEAEQYFCYHHFSTFIEFNLIIIILIRIFVIRNFSRLLLICKLNSIIYIPPLYHLILTLLNLIQIMLSILVFLPHKFNLMLILRIPFTFLVIRHNLSFLYPLIICKYQFISTKYQLIIIILIFHVTLIHYLFDY